MFLMPFQYSLAYRFNYTKLSDDFNSGKLSGVRARRNMVNKTVVHDNHNVRHSLEKFQKNQPFSIKRLALTFRNSTFLQKNLIVVPDDVSSTPFKKRHSQLIGGSRRFGEILAKIVAASTGETNITYLKEKNALPADQEAMLDIYYQEIMIVR